MALPEFKKACDEFPETCPLGTEELLVRESYDEKIDSIAQNPTPYEYFLGMTYLYQAYALCFPGPSYEKLRTPFLLVAGALDASIQSNDIFVSKAQEAGVDITYIRVEDMDHYIRLSPDIIEKSFQWLSEHLKAIPSNPY